MMIVGNSFKTVSLLASCVDLITIMYAQMMALTGVSNAKFAFLLQAMAATMSSLVPVSRLVSIRL